MWTPLRLLLLLSLSLSQAPHGVQSAIDAWNQFAPAQPEGASGGALTARMSSQTCTSPRMVETWSTSLLGLTATPPATAWKDGAVLLTPSSVSFYSFASPGSPRTTASNQDDLRALAVEPHTANLYASGRAGLVRLSASLTPEARFEGTAPYAAPLLQVAGFAFVGGVDSSLVAINTQTGSITDDFAILDNPTVLSPQVDSVAQPTTLLVLDVVGILSAFDFAVSELGDARWTVDTQLQNPRVFFVESQVAYALTSRNASSLIAVAAQTGDVKWRFSSPTGQPITSVAVSGDTVALSFSNEVLLLDATTGAQRWRSSSDAFDTHAVSSLMLTPDSILAASVGGELLSVSRTTFLKEWEASLSSPGDWYLTRAMSRSSSSSGDTGILVVCQSKVVRLDRVEKTVTSVVRLPPGASAALARSASPVVAPDGTVYAVSSGGFVYKIPPGESEATKIYDVGSNVVATPALGPDGSYLFVGDMKGIVHAISTSTGQAVWTQQTTQVTYSLVNQGGAISAPLALDPASGNLYVGTATGFLHAFKSATGTSVWPPLKLLDLLFVLPPDEDDGVLTSAVPLSEDIIAVGTEEADMTNSPTLFFVNTTTGTLAFGVKLDDLVTVGNIYSTPAVGPSGAMYLAVADSVAALSVAVKTKQTTLLWSYATGADILCSPALDSLGTLYIGNEDGLFFAFDSSTGLVKWTFDAGSPIRSSPAIAADGTVYVTAVSSTLYAFDGKRGELLYSESNALQGPFQASPAIGSGGAVIIASTQGSLYMLPCVPCPEYTSGGSCTCAPNHYNAPVEGRHICKAPQWPKFTPSAFPSDVCLANKAMAMQGTVLEAKGQVVSFGIDDDGTVYLGTSKGFVFCTDSSLRMQWFERLSSRQDTPVSVSSADPVLSSFNVFFLLSDGSLAAFDKKLGTLLFQTEIQFHPLPDIFFLGSMVIVPGVGGEWARVDAETGSLQQVQGPSEGMAVRASAYTRFGLYLLKTVGVNSSIALVDASTGKEEVSWSLENIPASGDVFLSESFSGDIYLSANRTVSCFSPKRSSWEASVGSSILFEPVVLEGRSMLYVVTSRGILHGISTLDGKERCARSLGGRPTAPLHIGPSSTLYALVWSNTEQFLAAISISPDGCFGPNLTIPIKGGHPGSLLVSTARSGLVYMSSSVPGYDGCRVMAFSCQACPLGFAGPTCEACPPGTFARLGDAGCTPCEAGLYAPTRGSAACVPCEEGYTSRAGADACTLCPEGKYSKAGDRKCTRCEVGKFADVPGLTACDACRAGTYASEVGTEECTVCPGGTYSTTPGLTSPDLCLPCSLGHDSRPGATGCQLSSGVVAGTTLGCLAVVGAVLYVMYRRVAKERRRLNEQMKRLHGKEYRTMDLLLNDTLQAVYLLFVKGKRVENAPVFISYAWPKDADVLAEVQSFLRRLKNNLETAGFRVTLDVESLTGGEDITSFMQDNIARAAFCIVVGTPDYKARAEMMTADGSPATNVGREWHWILEKRRKKPSSMVPLVVIGDIPTSLPSAAMSVLIRDFTTEEGYVNGVVQMIAEMLQIVDNGQFRVIHDNYKMRKEKLLHPGFVGIGTTSFASATESEVEEEVRKTQRAESVSGFSIASAYKSIRGLSVGSSSGAPAKDGYMLLEDAEAEFRDTTAL